MQFIHISKHTALGTIFAFEDIKALECLWYWLINEGTNAQFWILWVMEKSISPILVSTISHMKKLGSMFLLLFACCFALACGWYNVNISDIDKYPQPLIEPMQQKVGIFYNDDFRNFKTVESIGEIHINIDMGKANIALFDYILPLVFSEVTTVHHLPEDIANTTNIDIVIEPSIKSYSLVGSPSRIGLGVCITYAIKFYTPNNEPTTWMIEAEGFSSSLTHTAKVATQNAMRDFAAQFMTGVCNYKYVKELFDKQCKK